MKIQSYVLMLSFILTATAWSCPDLSGRYLCPKNQFHPDIQYSFQQSKLGTAWQYTITAQLPNQPPISSFEFVTDQINQTVVDQVSGAKLLVSASCTPTHLRVSGLANADSEKPIEFSELLSLTTEGNLSNLSHDLQGTPFQEYCERIK